jgi:rhamnulokinase
VTATIVAAVDLGASGGRVIAGQVTGGPAAGGAPSGAAGIELAEASRFPNEPVRAGGTLYWDILRLHGAVTAGLATAAARFPLAGVGIDSWGVDYGLLDAAGALVGNPVHYRDGRTEGASAAASTGVPFADLYAATGIQHLPFNTIYQLAAATGTPALAAARSLLLIPDLLAYWLTGPGEGAGPGAPGAIGAEVTNASTTALLDVSARTWATGLMKRAGLDPALFPPLRQPGEVIGPVTGASAALAGVPLITVASHDTASAVVAVPAAGPHFAYISSGTWSLVGLELPAPVLSAASREANFTNEAGIDGTVRYLRNVSGLWLLQECVRHWGGRAGSAEPAHSLDALLARAAAAEPLRFVVDAEDPAFLPPGDMPGRIAAWLAARGLPAPRTRGEVVRCVLDSLALAYRRALLQAQELSGRHADVIHVVGGGSRNDLLCQLTADAAGLPVVAGPAEATALGNVLVQARALGAAPGTLAGMRALVRASAGLRQFGPAGDQRGWQAASRRLGTG